MFLTGNFGVPPLNAYANAVTFALFQLFGGEVGPTAMRVTSALFGVLGVAAVFALGNEMRQVDPRLSPAYPLLAAAILALMRWHVHFSRMGIEPILMPLGWAAATWLLLRGWRTGSRLSFAGCGVVLAACMYTYQGAWVIPILVALTALLLWWTQLKEGHIGGTRSETGPSVRTRLHSPPSTLHPLLSTPPPPPHRSHRRPPHRASRLVLVPQPRPLAAAAEPNCYHWRGCGTYGILA